jgi:hypothetical protein
MKPQSAENCLADDGVSSAVYQQPLSWKRIKFSGSSGGVAQNIEETLSKVQTIQPAPAHAVHHQRLMFKFVEVVCKLPLVTSVM